ncbi:universal stress protein [Natranaeroarchaeum aerophilus]|uniref:Universal stress protein n=1 Tax=Natranaeroarchaeum aerophilus TaxID=2917711 RepID=A0AAE3FRU2_9EURY|nr:universal stress protein [Natranaeroarchaeum aerophilus]MCL9813930.1 universal stress protein [Natranaeroarchaeum aerophilus]
MYETILVPTDGSDPASRAVEHALELATRYDADVHALYCVETNRYGQPALSSSELVLDNLEDRGSTILAGIEDRAAEIGIETSQTVCRGRPWEEVHRAAAEIDADVIVIGYQGQGHSRTNRIGSVAERILRTPDRPVLTV